MPLEAITTDLLIRIGIFTLVMLGVWVAMKFILKIGKKVFLWGLGSIAVFAVVLAVMRILTQ